MSRTSLFRVLALCLALSGAAASVQAQSEAPEAPAGAQTYLIVYRLAVQPFTARWDVERAGGTLIASYPFGVAVATSSSETFASELSRKWAIESVAATGGAALSALPQANGYIPWSYLPSSSASGSSEPLASMQWNMDQIRAGEARSLERGRRSVVVGVMDSGIDDSVPDLAGQVDASRSASCIGGAPNSDPDSWNDWIGHGTHVAGIIGAKDDGQGVVGVAPGVSLAAINVVSDDFLIYPEAFICGLHWAASRGVQLVNASLILDPWYYYCSSDPTQSTISTAVQRAIDHAAGRGTTLIAALSNEHIDLANKTVDPYTEEPVSGSCRMLPAEANGVIGVSAVGGERALAFYSNYGYGAVDVAAPGGDMLVPVPGNESGQVVSTLPAGSVFYDWAIGWNGRVALGCDDGLPANDPAQDPSTCDATFGLLQGTSVAAPHVTGVAALVYSRFGNIGAAGLLTNFALTASETACTEMEDATCTGSSSYNGFYGSGIVDAYRAVRGF